MVPRAATASRIARGVCSMDYLIVNRCSRGTIIEFYGRHHLGDDDACEVAFQDLLTLAFEFQEHNAVAEFGMSGDHASTDDDGLAVEPEFSLHTAADAEWHHQLDVTAAPAEVSGFDTHRNVVAFLANLDLHLNRAARIPATIRLAQNWGRRLRVGRIHGFSPGLEGLFA